MLKGDSIVCLYCEDWDTPLRTSKHHLMKHFAQNNRVLYVEQPYHLLTIFKYPGDFIKRVKNWRRSIREVEPNIFVFSFFYPFPFHSFSRITSSLWVNQANQLWLHFWLKRVLKRLSFRNPIFWVYYPTAAEILAKFKPKLTVFHVIDEWSAFAGVPKTFPLIEQKLLEQSDLVIASSQALFDDKKEFTRNIHLIRHGANLELFKKVLDSELAFPGDINGIKKPIIGYYGALHKLDLSLIKYCAEERPEWSFLFVGPIKGSQGSNISELSSLRNVYFIGSREQQYLPNYLKTFDVAIMPFKVDKINLNMCPIKMYEFLAAGRPVVSTDLPEVRVLKDAIQIGKDNQHFLLQIERALDTKRDNLILKRQEVAERNSWEARFKEIENLLEASLEQKADRGGAYL